MKKVLTAAQMQAVDRRTSELGIPGLILMENAGHRVVEFIAQRYAPLREHRILIVCGKGNNGGDGLVIARQLFTRLKPAALWVVLDADPRAIKGDAAENLRMLHACGCPVVPAIAPEMSRATLVIDALFGTGLRGPITGPALDLIRRINAEFSEAKAVSVDLPSGIASDEPSLPADFIRADASVTFTALKIAHALPPACDAMGEIALAPIGSPPHLYEDDPAVQLALVEPEDFRALLAPRKPDSNKGSYGHVLAIAGSPGRSGAAAMCGVAALRAGAGLVTVASPAPALPLIAGYAPELMTEALPSSIDAILALEHRKTLVAIGPGLGTEPQTVSMARELFARSELPMVVDADALNALASSDWRGPGPLRVLTPHPGEMSRLMGKPIPEIQRDRVTSARSLASARNIVVILKGHRSLIAFPDGRVWINPADSPSMATGGTGDILTGLVSGFLAQFPHEPDRAIAAAVYLHGLSGQLGAKVETEQTFLATDLLRFLPAAIHACTNVPDGV